MRVLVTGKQYQKLQRRLHPALPRMVLVASSVLAIAGCSSTQKSQSTEKPIEPNTTIASFNHVELRKIVGFVNRAEYESAYQQILLWSKESQNLKILFDRDVPTTRALQVLAWKGDRDLFDKIRLLSPSQLRVKRAMDAAAENFPLLNKYYRCYFQSTGPSLTGCSNLAIELGRKTPDFDDIWSDEKQGNE